MDKRIIVIIAVLLIVIIACSVRLIYTKKIKKHSTVSDSIFGLFDPNNIIGVEFIRNKLVVSFLDATLFDEKKLKEYGGKGISVIGDKIKFFVSDNQKENKKMYDDLLNHIER